MEIQRTDLTDNGRLHLIADAVDQVLRAAVVIFSLGYWTCD